jgi:hypothetical protein
MRVYPPRYLEALRDIWESSLYSSESLRWLEGFKHVEVSRSAEIPEARGFPTLRARQRQAFDLLRQCKYIKVAIRDYRIACGLMT